MMQKRREVGEDYMKTKIGSFIVSKDKVQIMYISYEESTVKQLYAANMKIWIPK